MDARWVLVVEVLLEVDSLWFVWLLALWFVWLVDALLLCDRALRSDRPFDDIDGVKWDLSSLNSLL